MGAIASQITSLRLFTQPFIQAQIKGTGEFPAQMASNAEKVSIWWRHHVPNLMPQPMRKYVTHVKYFIGWNLLYDRSET